MSMRELWIIEDDFLEQVAFRRLRRFKKHRWVSVGKRKRIFISKGKRRWRKCRTPSVRRQR